MPSARIFFKKQVRIEHLSIRQNVMLRIATVGVASVKNRVGAALGPTDAPAKPLTKRYAITKSRLGKGNRRTLTLSGDLLRNFQVRSVSENRARASNSTRKDRLKAWINQKLEPWVVFSPKNEQAVRAATQQVLSEMAPKLALEKALNGGK